MKAYWVTECMENMGFICWAENGRAAKKLGIGRAELGDCCEFIDIRVKRCPLADDLFSGEVIADWWTEAGQRVYWKVGAILEDASSCDDCGETMFDKVPESHLNDDGLCAVCAEERLELELLEDEILGAGFVCGAEPNASGDSEPKQPTEIDR